MASRKNVMISYINKGYIFRGACHHVIKLLGGYVIIIVYYKADGLIGEQANGYLGLVRQDVPPDIKALVRDVNAKRKARYQSIAQKQSVPLAEVEKVGGTTAIDRTLRGNYIKDSSGRWRKK